MGRETGRPMIKVYICPDCGWLREVSRRRKVECFKCGNAGMELTKLSYEQYVGMSTDERESYADSWMYIHRRRK